MILATHYLEKSTIGPPWKKSFKYAHGYKYGCCAFSDISKEIHDELDDAV